jgi:anti-anti-sigma factor
MAETLGSRLADLRVMTEHPSSDPLRAEDVRQLGALTMRSTRGEDGEHVIALSGELDLGSAETVESELVRVEATDARQIVLDLRELDFLDSTGIRLVYMADMRSRQDGDRLIIRRGPDSVQRMFRMTDLADRLRFVD